MSDETKNDYKNYFRNAMRTEADPMDAFMRICKQPMRLRMLHAALGIADEGGEIANQIKGHLFYGKNLDLVNLLEELGDLLWFAAELADACGEPNFTGIMQKNIDKLKKRYPEKFTEEKAQNRDLTGERKILEGRPLE